MMFLFPPIATLLAHLVFLCDFFPNDPLLTLSFADCYDNSVWSDVCWSTSANLQSAEGKRRIICSVPADMIALLWQLFFWIVI